MNGQYHLSRGANFGLGNPGDLGVIPEGMKEASSAGKWRSGVLEVTF